MRLRGELSYITAGFGVIALIRLASSVILTRILSPDAYGLVTIVASIVFTIEMLTDLGIATLMVRHKDAESEGYLATLWTLRFLRSVLNAAAVFTAAPLLASAYGTPELTLPLRLFAVFFLFQGLESMSLLRAVRNQKASRVTLIELVSLLVSTAVSIALSILWRDHYGMIVGMVLNRGVTTGLSYMLKDTFRPRFAIDRGVCRELFLITRFVLPSTLITMAITQYDKVIFLKLFNLPLLGLYGLAASVSQAVDSVVMNLTRSVLLPRCTAAFRQDPSSLVVMYYQGNVRLHFVILALPSTIFGAAHFIIETLFDPRYVYAGVILQAFSFRSILGAFYSSAEDLLVASGLNHIGLTGVLLRISWLIPATLLGHYYFGFEGFLIAVVLDQIPGLTYYWWCQRKAGLMILRYEAWRLGLVVFVFAVASVSAVIGTGAINAIKTRTWLLF